MAKPFRHVDLCSGIGGFALGFQWAGLSEPVLFCDIEAWSRQALAKHWPDVPIAEDVKELASDPARLVPDCDILTAGYPCQPWSVAGKRRGEEDDRHIWPEIFTIVQAKRPAWCVFENVSGHISLGLNQVLSDLEDKAGYAVQTFVVPACAVNAPHRRDRLWIIAHTNSHGEPDGTKHEQRLERANNVGHADGGDCSRHNKATDQGWRQQGLAAGCEDVADANGARLQGHFEQQTKSANTFAGRSQDVADASVNGWAEHDSQQRSSDERESKDRRQREAFGSGASMADAKSQRIQGHRSSGEQVAHAHERQGLSLCGNERPATAVSQSKSGVGGMAYGLPTWLDEPRDIPRVATGVKQRAARLKGLGNAIVPQIAMQIGLTIKAVENG